MLRERNTMFVGKGSYFQLGLQQGQFYHSRGFTTKNVNINKNRLYNQLKIYQKFYPEMLDELLGIATVLREPISQVFYYFLCNNLFDDETKDYIKETKAHVRVCTTDSRKQYCRGCSIVGISDNVSGKLLVARNYDTDPALKNLSKVYRIEGDSNIGFIAITDSGVIADKKGNFDKKQFIFEGDDLVNDKGLYIGYTYSFSLHRSNGLGFYHFMRKISEKCETVKDAIKMAKTLPLCIPKNFFVSDRFGNMAIIEHNSGYNMVLLRPLKFGETQSAMIQTNHYVNSRFFKKYDKVFQIDPLHDTKIRYTTILEFLRDLYKRNRPVTMTNLKKRFNTFPIGQNNETTKTIWSLFLIQEHGRTEISI